MGILDEAIKEHLELKRQHGADASELQHLEDEAFGAAERPGDEGPEPDALAEAPTEFMQRPEDADAEGDDAVVDAGLPPAQGEPGRTARTEIADLQEPPAVPEAELEAPPEPEPPPDAEPSAPHGTAEREAIAEPPTEMYDVEAELGASESRAPSDEELAEEEMDEPRLAPVDPLSEAGEVEEAEDEPEAVVEADESGPEDFFDEQRLSDELDQALEAPGEGGDAADEVPESDDEAEDVLEETPDFLEEAPEDDRLWFEQKPPKDFDFDD